MMPDKHYWFTKWLLAFGLFLPFWGYVSLEAYTPEQSFLWNAANHPVVVGILPEQNIVSCWHFEVSHVINVAFGDSRESLPLGCVARAKWSYLYVLAVSLFMLIAGVYFYFNRPEYELYRIAEAERPRRIRSQTLDQEIASNRKPETMVATRKPRSPSLDARLDAHIGDSHNETLPPENYQAHHSEAEHYTDGTEEEMRPPVKPPRPASDED